ncbi:MAG: RidA family protein [Betaproteobacteria bacterium]|nr:RidA family protein [Betaproteobacteria bacterium]
MAKKEIVHVPGISDGLIAAKVPISAVVRANGFLFLSGLPPMDPKTGKMIKGDIVKQTKGSLNAVKHALKSAGSSLDQVVSVRIYISNAAYFGTVNEIYKQYFKTNQPARTFVTVGSWPMEFDIEVECIALA